MRRVIFENTYQNSNFTRISVRCEESPPQCRTIFVASDKYDQNKQKFYLSLPYVQYYHYAAIPSEIGKKAYQTYSFRIGMSFSNEPVKDLDSNVFYPTLPNFLHGGLACGLSAPHIDNGIMMLWGSPFLIGDQGDVIYDGMYYLAKLFDIRVGYGRDAEWQIEALQKWEDKTKENPSFILETSWPSSSKLLHKMKTKWPDLGSYFSS